MFLLSCDNSDHCLRFAGAGLQYYVEIEHVQFCLWDYVTC